MLHERYEPQDESAVAWSRVKVKALSTIIDNMLSGAERPRVLLLHGPTGCGKLCSLRVIVKSRAHHRLQIAEGNHEEQKEDRRHEPVATHVFHTCEAPPMAYYRFLRQALSCMEGSTATGLNMSSAPMHSEGKRDSSDACNGDSDDLANSHDAKAKTKKPQVFIVKFYGEPATSPLHRYTTAFVKQYNDLLLEASSSPLVLERLSQTLVFFIHTAHDTHSGKIDLSSAFPGAVLRSPAVELFHCTPITQISMRKRIEDILRSEAERRDPSCGLLRASSTSARGNKRKRARVECSLVSSEELNAITASSQGDIRQALLQTQWTALLGVGNSNSNKHTSAHHTTAADVENQKRLQSLCDRITGLTRRRCEADDRPPPLPTANTITSDACPTTAPQDDAKEEEEVLLADDNSSDDSVTFLFENVPGGLEKKTSSSSSLPLPLSPKKSRAPTQRTLFDLMEHSLNASMSSVPSPEEHSNSNITTTNNNNNNDKRFVVKTSRDEHMDLSHATARLLTQKYTLTDVMEILSVPPRKLLGYLTNNMCHYFPIDGIDAYEGCAAEGSNADAMRAAGSIAFGSQYRRNELATRTSDDAEGSALSRQVDIIALHVFDQTYRQRLPVPSVPRTFHAQRPPPFQKSAYPRLREISAPFSGKRFRNFRQDAAEEEGGGDNRGPCGMSEYEWVEACISRLADREHGVQLGECYPCIGSEEVDMLREGLPHLLDCCTSTDNVVQDYAPYAQYIVLNKKVETSGLSPSPSPSCSGNRGTTAVVGAPSRTTFTLSSALPGGATQAVSAGPPRRTTFMFSAAPTQLDPTKRHCSELRYRLLRRGQRESIDIRHGHFVYYNSDARRGGGGNADEGEPEDGCGVEKPLVPEGVTIEDFSD